MSEETQALMHTLERRIEALEADRQRCLKEHEATSHELAALRGQVDGLLRIVKSRQ